MPDRIYTTRTVTISDTALNGGLNSSSGPLSLKNNESSDLQNIDFDKFGSLIKRSGYVPLNTGALAGASVNLGLHWYEFNSGGTPTRKLVTLHSGTFYKMDDLDGVWDAVAGNVTISTYRADFTNFLNSVYVTSENMAPFLWSGAGNSFIMMTPANLQWAKYNEEFNNYLFLGNCKVGGVYHPSRVYWSTIKNTGSWTATNFIDVGKDDGQEITRIKKLGDRLVVYKDRSIYNIFFTGDPDVSFVLPGGGKSNSAVGCISPYSIQEVDNGHVFFSHDGLYYYDGNNSYKLSDKVTNTILGYNSSRFDDCVSLVHQSKNRYWLSFTTSGGTENNRLLIWDYYNNAFSIYSGMYPSSLATAYVNGTDERPYFADYDGFVYRADYGDDDYPLNTQTAITAYYYTNWRSYEDIVDQKGIPHAYIYHQLESSTITFAYSWDLDTSDQYSTDVYLGTVGDVYGVALYGVGRYSSAGGATKRVDLTGRGRTVRFKFYHDDTACNFQIDGLGTEAYLETQV